jgi:hypothetical protein
MSPDEAFERDIPEHIRDEIMYAIAGTASGWEEDSRVTILDRDRMDAINVRASGIIEVNGNEYWFIVEDGNWNGTVLHAWDYAGEQKFEYHQPTQWTLQPQRHLIDRAIVSGKGPFLLAKWDIMAARPEIAEIVRSYAYDRYVQPGCVTEDHWRDKAAKHHFEIVDRETADETRKRLEESTEPLETAW